MNPEEYEARLLVTRDAIKDAGKAGFTSYARPDEISQIMHGACLEMEERGLIRRLREQGDSVTWVPVE